MDYSHCLSYLDSYRAFGSHYGLDIITDLLQGLGQPDKDLKTVHVAGTNGKGSTIAFLTAILQAQGHTFTTYTSPEVVHYLDRFRINQEPVSAETFAAACHRVATMADALAGPDRRHASVFEMELAIALLLAQQARTHYYIQETGLGGRLDATNAVVRPHLILMAPVALDHKDLLGDTLGAIAQEKAGIFKPGVPILSAPQPHEVAQVFRRQAKAVHAPLRFLASEDIGAHHQTLTYRGKTYSLSLRGDHQGLNAALALEAAKALLGDEPGLEAAMRQGLATTSWPGRLEVLQERPRIYLDGAHNPQGAQALAAYLQTNHPKQKVHGLAHFYQDKDVAGILRALSSVLSSLTYVDMGYDRSLPSAQARILAHDTLPTTPFSSAPSLEMALSPSLSPTSKDDVTVVFGSLSHLQPTRLAYQSLKKEGP